MSDFNPYRPPEANVATPRFNEVFRRVLGGICGALAGLLIAGAVIVLVSLTELSDFQSQRNAAILLVCCLVLGSVSWLLAIWISPTKSQQMPTGPVRSSRSDQ